MSRGVLQRLSDPALVALCVPGDVWPRALLSSTLIPDAWMGLVERPDGRRRFVPAGDDPRPEDDDAVLLVRNRLITVPLDVSGCKASCGNAVDATCELLLKWSARDDDLASLRRSAMFGSNGGLAELSLDRLAQTLNESGARIALQRFVREQDAAHLTTADVRDEFFTALRGALAKFLFEIGASLERVAKLHFSSRTLVASQALERDAQQRLHQIKARELVEQAAIEATHRRLGELSGVFEKLKGLAAGNDRMQWHDLLPSLSPAERGRLLENLWRITPDRRTTSAIVVVAGSEVVWLDPKLPDRIVRRVVLPAELGGVRSANFDEHRNWLLLGAATGVAAIRAEDGEVVTQFAVPAGLTDAGPAARPAGPRTGFNSSAIIGEHVFATHSQLGCWMWPVTGGVPACLLAAEGGVPRTIRAVAAAEGRVLFAADDCVQVYDPADGSLAVIAAADDTIHCLTVLDHQLFVGTADGKVLRLDLRNPEDWWVPYRTNAAVETIHVRRWNDLVELVVPAGPQGIAGVYAEQNVVSRLLESDTPICRSWAADDILVGLNDRRDRLVVLTSSGADRRGHEVALARVLESSIQDACLVTTHPVTT
jgi:hypothetical protein